MHGVVTSCGMARLTENLTVVNRLSRRVHQWELREPFRYRLADRDDSAFVEVHEGFVTDFASVPRPLWWWIAPWGRHGRAAIIHDYLYQGGLVIDSSGQRRRPGRIESDRIFRQAMAVLDDWIFSHHWLWGRSSWLKWLRDCIALPRRLAIWLAVVVFGHFAYKRQQEVGRMADVGVRAEAEHTNVRVSTPGAGP